jgi:hypothetical protein
MKKQKKILTVSLFYMELEVVFHTNDVTLNSSIPNDFPSWNFTHAHTDNLGI